MRKGILSASSPSLREDSYAPKIIAELKQAEMIVVEGTLYPILTRQNAGLTYRWEEFPAGPPRKYYTLTERARIPPRRSLTRHGTNS